MLHFKAFRFGRAEKVLLAGLAGLTLLILSIYTIPAFAHGYEQLNHSWTSWAIRFGYFGAFLSAFVGSLSVVLIFPYTIIIFYLAARGLDPFTLGLLMGTGAFLGQLSGYVLGWLGSGPFRHSKPQAYHALERIVSFRPHVVQLLVFIFGMSPLPDDVLLIPLGMLRYPLWKLILPGWTGKIIAGWIVTYTGHSFIQVLAGQPALSPVAIFSQLGSLYTLAILLYLMFKVDWTKTMHRWLDHPALRRHKPEVL